MTLSEILAIFIVAAQALDGWTTYQGIKYGARERVWASRTLIGRFGKYWGLMLAKCSAAVFIAVLYWHFRVFDNELGQVALIGIAILYAYIIVNNVKVLQQQKEQK